MHHETVQVSLAPGAGQHRAPIDSAGQEQETGQQSKAGLQAWHLGRGCKLCAGEFLRAKSHSGTTKGCTFPETRQPPEEGKVAEGALGTRKAVQHIFFFFSRKRRCSLSVAQE